MVPEQPPEYYEILQVSSNADPETIHRVYRLLAQRFHPDNNETGDADRFRLLREAYDALSDPERRAQYDVIYHQTRQMRWRLVTHGTRAENDFEMEQLIRLTVLEVLYTRRRLEPQDAGIFPGDLEELVGRPREHLLFTLWYLGQKGLTNMIENSRLAITAQGVDYLEHNYQQNVQRRRLHAQNGHQALHEEEPQSR
jgi:curved DNA-binding protein CbpA